MDSSKSPETLNPSKGYNSYGNLSKDSASKKDLSKDSSRDQDMDLSKDYSRKKNMDLSKDPYNTKLPKHKTTINLGCDSRANYRNLVIGHSQVRDKWTVILPEEELNFQMDWISVSGGKATTLGEEIIRILRTYKGDQPLRISAIIWQNSVEETSLEDMKNLVRKIQEELDYHPEHKVAFPTLHFIPQQELSWEKVGHFNDYLREVNIRNGLNPYNLHKSIMKKKKGGGLKVQQVAFDEFQAGTGKGYHIAESKWPEYVRVIKKYHQTGFRDHEGAKYDHNPRATNQIMLMPVSTNKMKNPREVDLRRSLNDIKSRKRKDYGKKFIAEGELLVKKIAADTVIDNDSREFHNRQAHREGIMSVVNKIADETYEEEKRKREAETLKSTLMEEKKKILQKMNQRLMKWENHGKSWEDTLIKQERDLEEKEKELEMKEAEIKHRQQVYEENMERYRASDIKLKLAIAENELEVAKLERETRRRRKAEKKAMKTKGKK